MKTLKITTEAKAYSENEAKEYIEEFRTKAPIDGYIVASAGYTYKTKKAKGAIVDECWICKCVAEYSTTWEENLA